MLQDCTCAYSRIMPQHMIYTDVYIVFVSRNISII